MEVCAMLFRRFVAFLFALVVFFGFMGVAAAPSGIIVVSDDTFSDPFACRVGELNASVVIGGVSVASASEFMSDGESDGDDVSSFVASWRARGCAVVGSRGFVVTRWLPSGFIEVCPR
jgi:hypothetical protein